MSQGKSIVLVELNYQITPVHIREKISSQHLTIQEELSKSVDGGAFIIATCHRYSILTYSDSETVITECLRKSMTSLREEHLLILSGAEAIKHFFSTACGLHSRTIGEHEILGQIRNAYSTTENLSPELHELIKRTIRTGKRARTETCIGRYSTSLTSITRDRIKHSVPDLENTSVLLFGTGEMAQLILNMLKQMPFKKIFVASNSYERAQSICREPNMIPTLVDQTENLIEASNIIIGATWTTDHLISHSSTRVLNKAKLVIDLGMPRNFDPILNQSPMIDFHDLDTINETADQSIRKRSNEINQVHEIIAEEVNEFMDWIDFRRFVPEIKLLKKQLASLKKACAENISSIDSGEKEELTWRIHETIQEHFSQLMTLFRSGLTEKMLKSYEEQILNSLNVEIEGIVELDHQKNRSEFRPVF